MTRRSMLLLLPLVVGACGITPDSDKSIDSGKGYTIKTIDGCEYIEVAYGTGRTDGYYSLTHKGNCKNPIHQCATRPEQPTAKETQGK